jgi:hypothetical protein
VFLELRTLKNDVFNVFKKNYEMKNSKNCPITSVKRNPISVQIFVMFCGVVFEPTHYRKYDFALYI